MPHQLIRRSLTIMPAVILPLLLLIFSLSGPVQAADAPTAKVIDVSGPVRLFGPNDKARNLLKGDLVPGGYTVDCGPGGRAVLEIESGDRAEISEDSKVRVGELFAPEKSRFSVGLLLGRLTMTIKKLRGDDIVITPTFVCGVRGTRFSVGVADDGTSVVTVFQGTVDVSLDQVSTDSQGEAPSRRIDAGQEILAESSENVLSPRPAAIWNLEDWRSFREKRLEMMIPRLPQTVALFDSRIDAEIRALEKTAAFIISQVTQIKKLIERNKTRQRRQPGQLRAQTRELVIELRTLRRRIKSFRRHVMRLRTIFVRADVLLKKLPALKDRIGPEYPDVEQTLICIQERKDPTRIKVTDLMTDIKTSLKPLTPIWNKFKKTQKPSKQRR